MADQIQIAVENFEAYRGDTYLGDAFKVIETGTDWAGSTVAIQWRASINADPILTWALADGGGTVTVNGGSPVAVSTINTATLGELLIPMAAPASVMEQVPNGVYLYDVEVIRPDGITKETFVKGTVTVIADVTRA